MTTKLTDEDKDMIVYFHEHKGDLSRWCGWNGARERIKAEYPELIAAWDNFIVASRTLDAIVEKIKNE